ncbi:MAG: hypothetical protein HC851_16305 [Acaryochloris sp. RU_4_1]|nr:hypothetical protein [Acaryochloris sp. RU_4_1]NJR56114.1 hypothetical protein [Acaryochloris sp. CRU_2_0]
MLCQNIDYFKARPLDIAKLTILVDHGYHPDSITQALQEIYLEIMTKVQFEQSAQPSKAEKEAQGKYPRGGRRPLFCFLVSSL